MDRTVLWIASPRAFACAIATALLVALSPTAHADAAQPPSPAPSVLPAAAPDTGAAPSPAGIRAAIGPAVSKNLTSGAALVVDPASGSVLYEAGSAAPLTPASNAKLATAVAALTVLGPTRRIATNVVVRDRDVYLVGGGDPTLASVSTDPSIPTLAQLAEKTLTQVGSGTALSLHYDDSAFAGPTLAAGWSSSYPRIGEVAPVTALMVDQGRVSPGGLPRVSDPARQAAKQFARLLRAGGVTVTSVDRAKAPADATVIATVESPPVSRIVQSMLTESENTYAEALGHLVGGAKLANPSFDGGALATREVLAALKIDTGGFHLADASGLSRDDRMTARTLAAVLTAVVLQTHPELDYIATGLPIAGLTGTLAERYATPATAAGRGFVHAKTGTLTGVIAESGIVLAASGRQLVFSFIATRVKNLDAMRRTLDGIASTLATCGCTS